MVVKGVEAVMRFASILIIIVFILSGMSAFAGAGAAEDALYERYCGLWARDDFILNLQYKEGAMTGNLMQFEASGDNVVWEFTYCQYLPDEDILWCRGCTHYREHIDPETFQRTEEDWWLSDLSDIYFAFGDDEDTLIGHDIEDIGEPLVLKRQNLQD